MSKTKMTVAPIVLFVYKRLQTLERTVDCLKQNLLAADSHLYIFSDAARGPKDEAAVSNVRKYLKTISGFKSVTVFESPVNKGLAKSIIEGVTNVLKTYDRVIVLEDDLITATNFLAFMNSALDFYGGKNVYSVAGFSFPMKGLPGDSVYFTMRASSWGWATWKEQWESVDWKVKDYDAFRRNRRRKRRFDQMGSDLSSMLGKQMRGEIDSWAIRWCYHQFKKNALTVHPALSKVKNIGFDEGATHTTERYERYKTDLDESGTTEFNFTDNIVINPKTLRQAIKYYSIPYRVYYKLLNTYYRIIK